jgi:cytochrome c-type biogenesis protein CcmH
MKKFYVLFCLLISATPLYAQEAPTPVIPLPAEKELQAKSLFHELHCMVCNGQSLAESDAKLAEDMRNVIRIHMRDGEDIPTIKKFLTERYGDAILMQPPVKASTWVLWFAPLCMLLIGAFWLLRRVFSTTHHMKDMENSHDE